MRRCLGVVLACLLPFAAWAHSSSTSYVTIVASGHDASLQWSIALRDLDTAIGLDTNDDGDITWGERIASSRNAPERVRHCLTRMLPARRQFVNRHPTRLLEIQHKLGGGYGGPARAIRQPDPRLVRGRCHHLGCSGVRKLRLNAV